MEGNATFGPLVTLLGKAGAAGLGQARQCACDTPEDAVGFVLEAVQATILPRRLRFSADGTACLTLLASGGSLLRVSDAGAFDSTLLGRDLIGADIAPLCTLLFQAVEGRARLVVTSEPISAAPDVTIGGITAQRLLQECQLGQLHLMPGDLLATFQDGVQEVVLAHYVAGQGLKVMQPDPALSRALVPWIEGKLSTLATQKAVFDPMAVVFFEVPETALTLCVPISAAPQQALVLMPDVANEVAVYWSSLAGALVGLA